MSPKLGELFTETLKWIQKLRVFRLQQHKRPYANHDGNAEAAKQKIQWEEHQLSTYILAT